MVIALPFSPEIQTKDGKTRFDILHINGDIVIRPREVESALVDIQPLTRRETQVLTLVAEGYSNKIIGAELGISERTVKNHLTFIMTKLCASDRTHAVVTALRSGLLSI
ncbi:MAG: response regulator transcription factor [Chloroflexi bacterium]|nr:response regulator transcription factor [Chloroflexota bacterium]